MKSRINLILLFTTSIAPKPTHFGRNCPGLVPYYSLNSVPDCRRRSSPIYCLRRKADFRCSFLKQTRCNFRRATFVENHYRRSHWSSESEAIRPPAFPKYPLCQNLYLRPVLVGTQRESWSCLARSSDPYYSMRNRYLKSEVQENFPWCPSSRYSSTKCSLR
jgi:hypothetical protein